VPPFQGLVRFEFATQGIALGWLGAAPLVLPMARQAAAERYTAAARPEAARAAL